MTMLRRLNKFVIAGVVTGICLAASAASARTNFDGSWSVLVVTDYGTCDRAYRYGVQISNGQVFYRGDSSVDISGRVSPVGQVNVRVRQGSQQASGTGRLSQESGGGQWRGSSPEQQCGGHWTAERRG